MTQSGTTDVTLPSVVMKSFWRLVVLTDQQDVTHLLLDLYNIRSQVKLV